MHKIFIMTFMLILSSRSFAQNSGNMQLWLKMYPLVKCPSLVLEYIPLESGKYKIRIPKTSSTIGKQYYFKSELNDLNDLSSITDYIVAAENDYCPNNDLSIRIDGEEQICPDYTEKFSDDYVDLVKDITKIVSKDRKATCDNVLPYIKLQAEIEQLQKEDLLKFKRSKNIVHSLLKLALNDDTDVMIDHYNACGGRKGSAKFIKNMILIEVKNACIAPKPPGVMTWEDAEIIAKRVGDKYAKKNLLTLNSKMNSITKDAIMEFADKLTSDMVSDLIGPYMDPAKGSEEEQVKGFINNLNSYKNLKETDTDEISNYVSYVYSVDASIEVGKKAIPYLVRSNFEDKLPAAWSKERKKDFLDNVLIAKSQETYDTCMQEEKEYANYTLDKTTISSSKRKRKTKQESEKILAKRMILKEKYCTKNPDKCSDEICSGSANILSSNDTATDTQRVQGCVLKGLTLSIKPLLTGIIKDQKSEFIESFFLSNEMADSFSKKTWDTLTSCVNRNIAKKSNLDKVDFLNDDQYLQKISTSDFENFLVKCSDIAENKVTKEFVSQLLLNEETLKDAFNSGENITDEFGNTHNKDLINITKEITNSSFTPCLEKQYDLIQGNKTHGLDKKNSLLCTPIVEMNASLLVVQKKLEDMAKEKKLENNSEIKLIIKEYESCGETAINNALSDIGSTQSATPINSVEDSKYYLNKNNSLFSCVENAISNISFVIAGIEFEKIAKEQEDKIQNPKYLLSLKNNVQILIKECFQDGLNNLDYYGYITKDDKGEDIYQAVNAETYTLAMNKVKSKSPKVLSKQGKWSSFTSFNEEDGLDKLQTKCELLATQEVVPKLIIKEAGSQLIPLIKTGFLKDKVQVGNVLAQEAWSLRDKYNIRIPESIKKSDIVNYSLSEALKIHIEKGGDTDSFVAEVAKGIENKAIRNVHKNLIVKIQDKTQGINNKAKYSELDKWFSPQCLLDINSLLAKNKKADDAGPITMDNLAEYLQVGLDYSLARSTTKYYEDLKVLKAQCNNMSQFKNTTDFNSSKFYELIIKGQIYKTYKVQFKDQIDKQVQGLRDEVKSPNLAIKNKYIHKLQSDMDKVFKEKLGEVQFEKMMFNDNELLSFTQKNLDGLLTDDPKVKEQLTEMLLTSTFKNTSSGSFGSEFAKAQIISSIGLAGIDDSVDKANNKGTWMKIGGWRFGPNNYAKSSVKDLLGNPANVEKQLNWDKISSNQKSIYINTIAHGAVIGATRNEEFNLNTENSLKSMYSQEYLKENPVPRDTNPTYFNNMAHSNANMRYEMDLGMMKAQLARHTSAYGYKDFNDKLESIVKAKVDMMNLNQTKNSGHGFTLGAIYRPNKDEVRKMLTANLRSYITESNVIGGLDNYKYSHGMSFSEKMEDDITSRTKKKFFGNTAQQQKAQEAYQQRRLEWQSQNPMWGPKY